MRRDPRGRVLTASFADVNRAKTKATIAVAQRFIAAAETLLALKVDTYQVETHDYRPKPWEAHGAPIQQGAARRASMDLTRALADFRKP